PVVCGTHLVFLLELVLAHAHQADIAEIQQASALDTRDTVELPAADNSIEEAACIAAETPVAAEWQIVNPVSFEGVRHAADGPDIQCLHLRPALRIPVPLVLIAERVIRVEYETLREPLAQFEL